MAQQIQIVLADANPLVLSAMSEIFDRDPRFSLVATSSTAEGFLRTVMRVPVVLLTRVLEARVIRALGAMGETVLPFVSK